MKSRKVVSKIAVVVLAAATLIGSMGTVPAMAATSEQTIGIKGKVTAVSTLDITVPVQPLAFTIDSNGNFSSPAKTVTNNTAIPVYAYVTEVYGASGNYPELVNSNTYGDWSGIEHDATIARMALQLNSNELSRVYQVNSTNKSSSSNYIALGSVAGNGGELNLQLTGNYGKAWNNAEDIVFTYNANMIFTTIEGNFGNGGGGGVQTLTTYVNGDGDICVKINNLADDISGDATVQVYFSKALNTVTYNSLNVQEFGSGSGTKSVSSTTSNIVTFTDNDCSTHDFYAMQFYDDSSSRVGQSLWDDGLYVTKIKFTFSDSTYKEYNVTK